MAHSIVNAATLESLLADRHAKDVFIPQCKTDSSWRGNPLRLDAWAMRRSWCPVHTFGYEVKVSRSDFLADDKWHGYLPFCHSFYFVCLPGVIDPKELPNEVGLLVSTKNGTGLLTKRKAAYRDIEIDSRVLIYALMSRSNIVDNMYQVRGPETAEDWRLWLEQEAQGFTIGNRVSEAIRRLADKEIKSVREENQKLRFEHIEVRELQKVLDELGLKGWHRTSHYDIKHAMERAKSVIPEGLLPSLRTAVAALSEFVEKTDNS